MGTRHLIAVYVDGEYKVAQYGQWDGYPGGQGIEILKFLRDKMKEQFVTNVCGCRFGTDAEIKATWAECGPSDEHGFVSMDTASRHTALYPALSRDTGAKILPLIQDSGPLMLADSLSFAAASLFCEWAYVVDFDAGTFEVYKGFNKESVPEGERFASLPREKHPQTGAESDYYPVKLARQWKLDDLPSDGMFIKAFKEE